MITTEYQCDACEKKFAPDIGWIKLCAGLSGKMVAKSYDACSARCARTIIQHELSDFYEGGDVVIEIKSVKPYIESPRTLP